MAKYGSDQVGFMLLGSYSMLGSTSKLEDTVELKLSQTDVLGTSDEQWWSSGARKTDLTQDGWFDDASNGHHEAFKGLPTTHLPLTIAPHGNAGGLAIDMYPSVGRVNYTVQVSVGDVHKAQSQYSINGGKKAGVIAFPLGTKVAAGNTDADDVTISATQPAGTGGGSTVLHVTELTGTPTNCTIKLRHSTDGITYADLTTFAAVTPANVAAGVASEYATIAGQINKWVSVAWAYTGGSAPTVTFTVGVHVTPAP